MGKLSRGITYAINEHLTIAKLYALIDTAVASSDAFPGTPSIYDIVMGDLDSLRAIHTASSPSSPAMNDLMVAPDGSIDRYTGSAWVDLSVDVLYFVNNAGMTLVTGTPVVADAASAANVRLYANVGNDACPNPLGVSAGVFAPNATAAIQVRGLAMCRVNSPLSLAIGDHLRIELSGATALSSTGAVDTSVIAIVTQLDVAAPSSGNVLAMLVH